MYAQDVTLATAAQPGRVFAHMRRLGRRSFLRSLAPALGAVCLSDPALTAASQPGTYRSTTIGRSQGTQPLTIYRLGRGRTRVFVLGGQHGWPEANTVELARLLLAHFLENPSELPPSLGLDVMMVANPDGYSTGSRQLLSGVDPNRNWFSSDWQPDAFDSDGQLRAGLGGPSPLSERETRVLARWLLRQRPAFVVNYHSVGGFVLGSDQDLAGELVSAYAAASGYPWIDGSAPFGYPITGSMDDWLTQVEIANIFVELASPNDPEFDANLAGLRAVLNRLARATAT